MLMKYEVLKHLADGKWHSGEELGHAFGVSRSAICKIMAQFTELGIEIYRIKGKGYQIPQGLELLSLEKIHALLPKNVTKQIQLTIMPEIDSTNQYLLERQKIAPSGTAVFAEYQTKGRGRCHRSWYCAFGSNLYFSILWKFEQDAAELKGLSLAAGVAVIHALERYGLHGLQLKWPNDVLWNYQKVAGILIEMNGESNSSTHIVLGIGINVHLPQKDNLPPGCIDLTSIISHRPLRHQLAAYLIEEIIAMINDFSKKGFLPFFPQWQALDAYFQQPIKMITPQKIIEGVGKGINQQGEYLVRDHQDNELRFLHGEVSLRSNDPLRN